MNLLNSTKERKQNMFKLLAVLPVVAFLAYGFFSVLPLLK